MTSQDAATGEAATGKETAAELLAAVRAVESGERSADSFFTERAPRRAARPASTTSVHTTAPGTAEPDDPVRVPDAVRAVLAEGGAPESLAPKAVAALGPQAGEMLRTDPWQLLAVREVQPEQADTFARELLGAECGPGDERRSQALVVRLLERAALRGHTALEPGTLSRGLAEHGVPDPEDALRSVIDAGAVLAFEDALDALGGAPSGSTAGPSEADGDDGEGGGTDRPVRVLVGLERCALAEESLADGLARIGSTFPSSGDRETWEAAAAAAPPASAAELIRAAAGSGLVAHTGGEAARQEPAALVAAARGQGLQAYAAVHSAAGLRDLSGLVRAASRADGAGEDAAAGEESPADQGPVCTVDGLLAGREGPARDAEGLWELDLLVVCDAVQLDTETAAALVESVPDGARLVLSGDPHGLGPAGPGHVFHDLLAARVCPRVVSRTPDPGPLGELVSGIGAGELQQVAAPDREVVIVPVRDAADAVHRTVQLVADSVPRALGVPAEETQVVTPGHGGGSGTRALNAALKERLNPGPGRFGGFDPGDRVVHSPAPGRGTTGTVVEGGPDGLCLDLAGRRVVVRPERVPDTVRHGWAITAHQAAGSRWPAVVAVLPGDAKGALTREWVYTAFGRAARHLSVVHGADEALAQAVAGVTAPERTTRLRTLLAHAAGTAAAGRAQGPEASGDR